jgi:precorrin-6A/cobalt-precorrin-6A reductase
MADRKPILVMAGTREGRELAQLLATNGFLVYETSTSLYNIQLQRNAPGVIQLTTILSKEKIIGLSKEKEIEIVIDATHPYAVNASLNAITACQELGIKYIRYEREETTLPISPLVFQVKNYDEAASRAVSLGKRIFLTIGSHQLKPFVELARQYKAWLIVRILPWEDSIQTCRRFGISPSQILAMQGPFSQELNRALFREYKAEVIVSKNTGVEGGFAAKLDAALELGIPMVVIKRPELNYPIKVNNYTHVFYYL